MRIEELTQAIDRHGGDIGHWPADLRVGAEGLIARDEIAARLVADAGRLDATLAEAVTPVSVDAALIGRIISAIGSGTHADPALHPTPRLAAWVGAAMIAFLSSGYAVGLALPTSEGEDTFAGLMFGGDLTAEDTNGWSQL